jgi:recombination protein RecA
MSTARVLVPAAAALAGFVPGAREVPGVVPASRLGEHPTPATVPAGIAALDALTGGFPRGALSEICGPASSGRTSVLLALLAALTRRREVCTLVDASDSFDPHSATAAGVDLARLLWVRCAKNSPRRHSVEQTLKATDLLLQGGGFGLVAVDLGDIPPHTARRIPLTSWFRFRRAVEHTSTLLLVLEEEPFAGSCASLVVRLAAQPSPQPSVVNRQEEPTHARLLAGLRIEAEVLRTQDKKLPRSASAAFQSRAAWTG